MQGICKQIRESRREANPNFHGCGSESEKPHPNVVQPLDLTAVVAPENLKPSTTNNVKSCAKRECLCCESASTRKPLLQTQRVEKKKERDAEIKQNLYGFMPLPELQEEVDEDCLEENDENRTLSHRWNLDSISFARYCEAKLEDTLKSDSHSCDWSPNAQRTDCCFEVLEEMCQNNLPFSSVLRHICDQLRRATYGNSQDSNAEERPYFELTEELEHEIEQMQAENLSWKSTLSIQHRELMTTRGELQEIGNELSKADTAGNELGDKLSLTEKAMSSEKEKGFGRHEVKRAQQIEASKEKELEEFEKLKASYMQLVHQFQHAQAFLHAAQCEVAESAPKKDLIAAKAEILELENKISQVQAQVETYSFETRSLTPRPQWGRQVPGMDKPPGVSTAQQIEKICRENAFLAASASRLQINFAATELTLAEKQGHKMKSKAKADKKPKPTDKGAPKKAKARSICAQIAQGICKAFKAMLGYPVSHFWSCNPGKETTYCSKRHPLYSEIVSWQDVIAAAVSHAHCIEMRVGLPNLSRIALRILFQQDCSAGACERNWSAYSLIYTKIQNRLSTSQLEKLVYCRANMRLVRSYHSLGQPKQVDATELKMVDDPRPEEVDRHIRDEQEQILRELHRELESVDRRVTRSRARALSHPLRTVGGDPDTVRRESIRRGRLPIRSNRRRANEAVRLIHAEIADMPGEACGAEVVVQELTYAEPNPEFDEEGNVLDDGGLLSTDDSSSASDTDF
ncbi:hypothetical protein GOP47_0004215 [Adiantum capillus-veneris]|uniref:HAT C-terminal dimerisation domain-containing protein n=1 Tax=Adiantum capillus-veneris TaxID=13818 RepID=A0A9D4V7Q6_ADICA|nr:hypothetical protein GOP47_0004215 [Adiantum capillus-veneris]